MAGLILCRSKYAQKPYYIGNMGININSLEELCYYIYHNIYLVGQDLIDEGLIGYIERDLEEPELARQLTFLNHQNAGFAELVTTILRYVDFYSDEEIEALSETIDLLDRQNALERLKSRADSFLENRRYNSAIRNYEMIVYGKHDSTLSMDFYGNVWHNMGVAYARMFSYKEAASCFESAYSMNENEASKQAAVAAFVLSDRYVPEEGDEEQYVASKEIETLRAHVEEERAYQPVREAFELRAEGKLTEYHDAIDRLIENWKLDYKNYMK